MAIKILRSNRFYRSGKGKCKICFRHKKINTNNGLCLECSSWFQYWGNPKITNIGTRFIYLTHGKHSIIWNRETEVFKSCTCTSCTVYKGGSCRIKSLCYVYLTALGIVEDPIILPE